MFRSLIKCIQKLLNLINFEKLRCHRPLSTIPQPQPVGSSDWWRGRVTPELRGNVLYVMNVQRGKGKGDDFGKIAAVPGE